MQPVPQEVLDPRDQLDLRVLQAQQGQLVVQEVPDLLDPLAALGQQARQVQPVPQEVLDLRDQLDLRVLLAQQVQLVVQEVLDPRDQLVRQVLLARRVLQAQ